MKIILFLVFISVALQHVSSSGLKFRDFQERIVGGLPADPGQYPYQVSLLRYINATHVFHTCGGSIIDDCWILTAAHCVYGDDPSQFLILAGTNIIIGPRGQYYNVSKIIWHEQYNQTHIYGNDIALLKTDTKITFIKNFVKSIALATLPYPSGTELEVSGWGRTGENSSTTTVLQWVTVKVENMQICKEKYATIGVFVSAQTQICTYIEGKGVCNGDSGGPLAFDRKYLAGIVSFGVPCAQNYPDVYTNVRAYRHWISSKIFFD